MKAVYTVSIESHKLVNKYEMFNKSTQLPDHWPRENDLHNLLINGTLYPMEVSIASWSEEEMHGPHMFIILDSIRETENSPENYYESIIADFDSDPDWNRPVKKAK